MESVCTCKVQTDPWWLYATVVLGGNRVPLRLRLHLSLVLYLEIPWITSYKRSLLDLLYSRFFRVVREPSGKTSVSPWIRIGSVSFLSISEISDIGTHNFLVFQLWLFQLAEPTKSPRLWLTQFFCQQPRNVPE